MILKGTVKAYDASTGLVSVEIVGGRGGVMDVAAGNHLTGAHLVVDKRCLVVLHDGANARDGVVVAVYDELAATINADVQIGVGRSSWL
jgi:hypothetical protein